MRKFFFSFPLLFILTGIFKTGVAFAHCPLCSAAAGMAVTVTRVWGVDDVIVGTFIGLFAISTGLWISNWLTKRRSGRAFVPLQGEIVMALSLVSTVLTLELSGIATLPEFFKVFGMSRLMFGMLIGGVVSWLAVYLHAALRSWNSNKNHVPLQGMILPLLLVVAANAVMAAVKFAG